MGEFRPGQSMTDNTPQPTEQPNFDTNQVGADQTMAVGQGGGMSGVIPVPPHDDKFKGMWMQFIGTENIGLCDRVERSVMIGGKLNVIFESGTQMSVEQLNQTCLPIEVPGDMVPQLKGKYNTEPAQTLGGDTEEDFLNNPVGGKAPTVGTPASSTPVPVVDSSDPIVSILQKKKQNSVKITLELDLDLPSKGLYNMLLEDFDATPNQIFKYCLTDENLEKIADQISAAILAKYNPDYVYVEKHESDDIVVEEKIIAEVEETKEEEEDAKK